MSIRDKITRDYSGHPQSTRLGQEKARIGLSPSNIPTQIKTHNSSFRSHFEYRVGHKIKPIIVHDKGHLALPRAVPTLSDKVNLEKWKAMTLTAEYVRPDLVDALASYNHFLNGRGETRTFSYERYVSGDDSGRITLQNAINHIKIGVIKLWEKDQSLINFNVSGPAIPCGSQINKSHPDNALFPYPQTENWQKAIGAHIIWLSGNVNVVITKNIPHFYLIMTLHAEDMYNFNPGQKDITTGIPDSENGRFTQTRQAHPYLNTSALVRSISWKGTTPKDLQSLSMKKSRFARERQPGNNIIIWNRI